MGVDDDPAFGGLPEHLGQSGDRDRARPDDVAEDLTGTDRGKLIDVADQQQAGLRGNRLHHGEHQRRVDHAGLVDDEKIAIERVFRVAFEAAVLRIGFQQPVDGLRLDPGLLGHALGGAARRRGEQNFRPLGGENAQDGVEQRRLADAGAAGDHRDLGAQNHLDRGALGRRQRLARLLLDPGNGLVDVDRSARAATPRPSARRRSAMPRSAR